MPPTRTDKGLNHDPAAYLAVPKAIEVHATFDLDAATALADEAERRLGALRLKTVSGIPALFMRAVQLPSGDPFALWRRLIEEHGIEVPVYERDGRRILRVSIGPYNDESDVDRLISALGDLLWGGAGNRKTLSDMMIQEAIQQLLDGRDLGRETARAVMGEIMSGEATSSQIAGFVVALRAKGETADEIAGCAEAMHEHVLPIHPMREDVVDVVGTGGDGAATFNISTTAAIVAATAGAAVAKHGNRAVSSVSGSADVLEALGFTLELSPELIAESIDVLGFGFMFAPVHHPAMRHAAPVRRELGTRTIFNVLGPLTNPAGARGGIFGVYSPDLVRTIADVLVALGSRRAYVVHGAHGIDELSPAGPNLVCEVLDGNVRQRTIDPLEIGIERCDPGELVGGTPDQNARTAREVLAGARGGKRDAVLLNAAGAIAAAGHAADLREGLALAADAIDSGRAGERLEQLVRFSRGESH